MFMGIFKWLKVRFINNSLTLFHFFEGRKGKSDKQSQHTGMILFRFRQLFSFLIIHHFLLYSPFLLFSLFISPGVGKFLMAVAERISFMFGFNELAVISGVGVRGYYAKLGYHLDETCEGEYMVKRLTGPSPVGEFLPLMLFGHAFENSEIEKPLSQLTICCQHLPQPMGSQRQSDGSYLQTPLDNVKPFPHLLTTNYCILPYKKIQNESPQLIALKATAQNGAVLTCPISRYANVCESISPEVNRDLQPFTSHPSYLFPFLIVILALFVFVLFPFLLK
jgi:hypothetical protein